MNIHVVHLPHSFHFLVDLCHPFYQQGFSSVTLVANGFNSDQINALNRYAEKHEYIRVLDIPTRRVLSHGQALNFAFQQSKGDLFCFADHDIFPTAPIAETIHCALKESDVVCFGDRPENLMANYKGFSASSLYTQSGVPLATSFFSIYRRSAVSQVETSFSVGFEQYFRKQQLPDLLARHPDIEKLKEPFLIDTGKAMSVALNHLGRRIKHSNFEHVCHLGGLSGAITRYLKGGSKRRDDFIFKHLPSPDELEHYYSVHQKRHPQVMELKRQISDYSLQMIVSLKEGGPPPTVTCEDEQIEVKIKKIAKDLKKAYSGIADS